MTTEQRQGNELDPGAYIGHEPEREGDSIPGGVQPRDERVAAYDSQPGVAGEPEQPGTPVSPEDADEEGDEPSDPIDGDTSDIIEGSVGSATLKDPDEAEPFAADLEALPDYTAKAMQEPFSETWGDQPADAGLVVDDPAADQPGGDQVVTPAEPTPDDPGADPGDIPALGGPLPA